MISHLDEEFALEVIKLLVDLARYDPNAKAPILRLLQKDVERVNATKGKKGSYKNAEKLSTLHVTIKLIEGDGVMGQFSNKEIADFQSVSQPTISNYLNSILDRVAGIEGLLEEIHELTDLPFRLKKVDE
jgi:DNA-binding NarL/FixJ family response regulator